MANFFQPIDASQSGWEDELKRRQELNAQIDFMNQMSQSNPDNGYLQQALMQQYIGTVFPEQLDYGNLLGYAQDLVESGDPDLMAQGKKTIADITPLLYKQYGYTPSSATTGTTGTDNSSKVSNLLADFAKEFSVDTPEGEVINQKELQKNRALQEQAQANPSLVQQYFDAQQKGVSLKDRMNYAQSNTKEDLPGILSGYFTQFLPSMLGAKNNDIRLQRAGFSDYTL